MNVYYAIKLDASRANAFNYFGGFKPAVAAKPHILVYQLASARLYSQSEWRSRLLQDIRRLRIRGYPSACVEVLSVLTLEESPHSVRESLARTQEMANSLADAEINRQNGFDQ